MACSTVIKCEPVHVHSAITLMDAPCWVSCSLPYSLQLAAAGGMAKLSPPQGVFPQLNAVLYHLPGSLGGPAGSRRRQIAASLPQIQRRVQLVPQVCLARARRWASVHHHLCISRQSTVASAQRMAWTGWLAHEHLPTCNFWTAEQIRTWPVCPWLVQGCIATGSKSVFVECMCHPATHVASLDLVASPSLAALVM